MSEKITDEEISLYLSGELSSKDEERVKKAADKDPKIASTLEDIQIVTKKRRKQICFGDDLCILKLRQL